MPGLILGLCLVFSVLLFLAGCATVVFMVDVDKVDAESLLGELPKALNGYAKPNVETTIRFLCERLDSASKKVVGLVEQVDVLRDELDHAEQVQVPEPAPVAPVKETPDLDIVKPLISPEALLRTQKKTLGSFQQEMLELMESLRNVVTSEFDSVASQWEARVASAEKDAETILTEARARASQAKIDLEREAERNAAKTLADARTAASKAVSEAEAQAAEIVAAAQSRADDLVAEGTASAKLLVESAEQEMDEKMGSLERRERRLDIRQAEIDKAQNELVSRAENIREMLSDSSLGGVL